MPMVNGNYVAPNWVNDQAPAIDAAELNAISQTVEGLLLPKITVTTADSYSSVTATNGTTTVSLTEYSGFWAGFLPDYGTWAVTAVGSGETGVATVDVDAVKEYRVTLAPDLDLENVNWMAISLFAQAGTAANVWSVGDTKSVLLSGTVGTVNLNTTLYIYIIGINHRGTNGITFQGFKTAQTNGTDVCLVDSKYGTKAGYSGDKYFQLNHWGTDSSPYNTNYGGWAACDMRYDILGSTNVAPTPYGSVKTTDATGSDPTSTCATSPVANTLMSCIPSDLRAVMRPMAIYTDNVGNANNTAAAVTATTDYLPLLAEFEIFGTRTSSNQYEQNNQTQYAYYSAGNSKVKYKYNSTGSVAFWWERSPYYDDSTFCSVGTNGAASYGNSRYSIGIAPIFMV